MMDFRKFRYIKEVLAILIIAVAVLALYYTFIPFSCTDYACFEKKMEQCKNAVYVNEQNEGSWRYEVLGVFSDSCNLQVTLLSAKNTDLGLRDYEGYKMRCSYKLGIAGYPEKNLDACHGPLKEGLQKIVINKLYKYVVSNLGEINEELLI
jgi:hypothetical protein